jgi:K+-sensing histidine kinase KdpD
MTFLTLKRFNYFFTIDDVTFSTISTRSYITMVLILCEAKLGTSTLVPLGFQNLYAKTRNGNNT